jgi:hypothetical protein
MTVLGTLPRLGSPLLFPGLDHSPSEISFNFFLGGVVLGEFNKGGRLCDGLLWVVQFETVFLNDMNTWGSFFFTSWGGEFFMLGGGVWTHLVSLKNMVVEEVFLEGFSSYSGLMWGKAMVRLVV